MDSVFITTRKQRVIRELRDYMLIALGMLMYAIGWTVFLLPIIPSLNSGEILLVRIIKIGIYILKNNKG